LGHKEAFVTHLRQLMLDELQRRNYSQSTVRSYIFAVEDFAKYFHRSPERLGPDHIRQYQAYLFRERKLSPGTIQGRTAALRFLFVKTLRRPYLPDDIPSFWSASVGFQAPLCATFGSSKARSSVVRQVRRLPRCQDHGQ
jgi:hypothetical protein